MQTKPPQLAGLHHDSSRKAPFPGGALVQFSLSICVSWWDLLARFVRAWFASLLACILGVDSGNYMATGW